MTDTSGPTREARNIADTIMPEVRSLPFKEECVLRENLALAIDAHTQALRAENALLRDRLRLAVEALGEIGECADNGIHAAMIKVSPEIHAQGLLSIVRKCKERSDIALRAAGVEI